VRGAAFGFPIDSLKQIPRQQRRRGVGGEAWVRGAAFGFPID